ncbi:unnamed protein product [Parnassius apollo]|uniref:(apollo) hypothetical protein n=1 Tax=Parnassius apollo TaxID=110799 RepID=A0A8S3WHM2_PARAO|nr:unnamed protein product [Parnassius apollo]
MEDKTFVWNSELSERLVELRFENDCLFKKKKQPWKEFHKILLENGFPEEMTVKHVRKKWSYTYDTYKIAKKTKNKSWKYYKLFEKHYGKSKMLDKYDSWSDDLRLKLVYSISEAKDLKLDFQKMWRAVEKSMRMLDLPSDCCIQDLKGLWHHIRTTFNRKHRQNLRKGSEISEWPLYEAVLNYYRKFEPELLVKLETESPYKYISRQRKPSSYFNNNKDQKENCGEEFQWSKDITESFIQIRLQNDWLFREKKWAWNDLLAIMIEEYEFPRTLTGREICKKWASTYSEYQKAKATNNKSWVYYTLFELYLGEGSLNPLVDWQEEWVFNLISARTDLHHLFKSPKDHTGGWREVEKKLRNIGIPLDHSLLEIPEIWTHLLKTFKWKQKFANKGLLNEQWPYYGAVSQYFDLENETQKESQNAQKEIDETAVDDDFEDDIKLLDLKQMWQVEPKYEYGDGNQCRSCSNEEGCVNVFEEKDEEGVDLALKLKLIGGVEVEKRDSLPSHICMSCVTELENAYKFRRKCQEADRQFRDKGIPNDNSIKIELLAEENDTTVDDMHEEVDKEQLTVTQCDKFQVLAKRKSNAIVKREKEVHRKRKKPRKLKYDYRKVCEVCGKHTRNLVSHLDTHSKGKTYSCDLCDKKFKFKSGLVIHKAVHNPTPRKTCEVCGKTFHILAQYRRHFVYHANERKYGCETCGKRFNTLDILKVHNRTHTDERPFTCQECGKTFRTAGCVSRHKRIVHRSIKNA